MMIEAPNFEIQYSLFLVRYSKEDELNKHNDKHSKLVEPNIQSNLGIDL